MLESVLGYEGRKRVRSEPGFQVLSKGLIVLLCAEVGGTLTEFCLMILSRAVNAFLLSSGPT